MREISKYELHEVVGGEGNAAVQGVATAIGVGIAMGVATAATTGVAAGLGLAAVAAAGVATAANPSINAESPTPSCTPSSDPLGSPTLGAISCDDGGGGGGGKVICTELCRNGVIEHDVWMADIRYSRENFSEQTMRGYHLWGIPYVKLMRKSPLFAQIATYPTSWFAEDIAYRMGVRAKPNLKGWVLREILFRPICSVIGVFAKARDWQALWRNEGTQAVRS